MPSLGRGCDAYDVWRDARPQPLFFNGLTLVLGRYFVHRLRMVTGKEGNPLSEVELLTESLMNNGGVLRGDT